jgi:hypothetical protein
LELQHAQLLIVRVDGVEIVGGGPSLVKPTRPPAKRPNLKVRRAELGLKWPAAQVAFDGAPASALDCDGPYV